MRRKRVRHTGDETAGDDDTRAPGFAEEAHRQSALVAAASSEAEDQAWVDDVSEFNDEGAALDSESESGEQE
nr:MULTISPECIES: antitoxin MazE-like protein [Mycobacteriaceae]